jgi:hypothetical protein
VDWSYTIDKDGILKPNPDLSERQLLVLEAKLKVALAQVQLMTLERRLKSEAQPFLLSQNLEARNPLGGEGSPTARGGKPVLTAK